VAEGLVRTLDEMDRCGVDALVLGREGNARFVSEATRLWLAGTRPFAPGCVVVRDTGVVHLLNVTDFGVPAEIPPGNLYPISWNPANIVGAVTAVPGISRSRRIGVDGLTPMFGQLFAAALPRVELVDGEAVMRVARRVKTPAAVERIRAAVTVAEDALAIAVDALRPGVRESELKGVFEERMCQLGTTTPAYEATFSVTDGDRPVRRLASDRVVAAGDLVAMSAGALVDGWEGSLARTWPCGAPTAAHRGRWSRWFGQWTKLVDRCRAGVRVGDPRAVAPGVAVNGVGLGYEGLEDDVRLEPGMVVQLELEGAGVLGADMLLIADDRSELLTTFAYPAVGG